MTTRRFAPLGLLATAMFALAACGGGSGSSDVTAPADADLVIEALDGNRFDQTTYTAAAGDVKVAYLGMSAINHTLLISDAENTQVGEKLRVTTGRVAESTYTFEPGTYTLFCDVPGHSTMKATLTVS
jgi:plastocyanin